MKHFALLALPLAMVACGDNQGVERPVDGAIDAPDIDTTVFVNKKLPVGKFAEVTIKEWRGYDLVAA